MKHLVLIRGLPGSGKSTIAKAMTPAYVHYEADMYFMRGGEYQFNAAEIKIAHQWCQDMVSDELEGGRSVVVANTFTQNWEMAPYLRMAKEYGARCSVIVALGEHSNTHGVPDDVIRRMRERWED